MSASTLQKLALMLGFVCQSLALVLAVALPGTAAEEGPGAGYLERGLDYLGRGEYARAVLEFEQALQLDYLAPDPREQAEAYGAIARRYQRGERLTFSSFAETGLGYYRENTTASTRASGDDPTRDPFGLARLNGGVTYLRADDWSLDGGLDYRFRYYDADGRRNDSDLRWRGSAQRALEAGSVVLGARGRTSYRGDGRYRNDFGVFVNRSYLLDGEHSVALEADVRRRQYPSSLAQRNRSNASVGVTWNRAERDGAGSLSINLRLGREWRRSSAPDGDATIYGASVDWGTDLGEAASVFLFGWYEHNGFHADRVLFDETEAPVGVKTRADDLFEFGGGMIYRLGGGWTVRPEILYARDESNDTWGNYSSTELWVAVRRVF